MGRASGLPTSSAGIRIGCRKQIAGPSRQHARPTKRDRFVSSRADLRPIQTGEAKMISFKALAAAMLLAATAATPALARVHHAPFAVPGGMNSDQSLYVQNLRGSGYSPRNDFNANGTMRAAIQEPGLFAF